MTRKNEHKNADVDPTLSINHAKRKVKAKDTPWRKKEGPNAKLIPNEPKDLLPEGYQDCLPDVCKTKNRKLPGGGIDNSRKKGTYWCTDPGCGFRGTRPDALKKHMTAAKPAFNRAAGNTWPGHKHDILQDVGGGRFLNHGPVPAELFNTRPVHRLQPDRSNQQAPYMDNSDASKAIADSWPKPSPNRVNDGCTECAQYIADLRAEVAERTEQQDDAAAYADGDDVEMGEDEDAAGEAFDENMDVQPAEVEQALYNQTVDDIEHLDPLLRPSLEVEHNLQLPIPQMVTRLKTALPALSANAKITDDALKTSLNSNALQLNEYVNGHLAAAPFSDASIRRIEPADSAIPPRKYEKRVRGLLLNQMAQGNAITPKDAEDSVDDDSMEQAMGIPVDAAPSVYNHLSQNEEIGGALENVDADSATSSPGVGARAASEDVPMANAEINTRSSQETTPSLTDGSSCGSTPFLASAKHTLTVAAYGHFLNHSTGQKFIDTPHFRQLFLAHLTNLPVSYIFSQNANSTNNFLTCTYIPAHDGRFTYASEYPFGGSVEYIHANIMDPSEEGALAAENMLQIAQAGLSLDEVYHQLNDPEWIDLGGLVEEARRQAGEKREAKDGGGMLGHMGGQFRAVPMGGLTIEDAEEEMSRLLDSHAQELLKEQQAIREALGDESVDELIESWYA